MGEERLIPVPPRARRAVTKVIDERVIMWYCDKELLEELPPALALELWQDLRHVRDWVESSPEERAVVFNREPPPHVLAKRREARASAPELAVPLNAFTEMRSETGRLPAHLGSEH